LSPPSAIDWQGKRKTEWQRQYPVEQQGGCSGTPQHTLPGISIAADAECSRPKVHKSLTGGKYCSCDEESDDCKDPQAGESGELEGGSRRGPGAGGESDETQTRCASLGGLRAGGVAGHRDRRLFTFQAPVSRAAVSAQGWTRPLAAGKCQKDAEMESRLWRSGFHHEAPLRACEEVRGQGAAGGWSNIGGHGGGATSRRTGTSTATTTTRSTSSEPRTTPEEPTTTEPRTTPEEPTATKKQLPTHLLTAIRGFDKADLHTTQQPESESGVIPPAPPVPAATGEKTVRSNRDRSSWTTSRRNASG